MTLFTKSECIAFVEVEYENDSLVWWQSAAVSTRIICSEAMLPGKEEVPAVYLIEGGRSLPIRKSSIVQRGMHPCS
jgi:hypothetical protein